MKVNTAAAFILAGVALALFLKAGSGVWKPTISKVCAGLVTFVGLLTLLEYLLGWDLFIDQILFKEPAGAVDTFSLGRMAPNTAMNFLLLGSALLLLHSETRHACSISQLLALIVGLVAWLPIFGYLYQMKPMAGFGPYTLMAFHTALTFVFLSIGVFMARADRAFASVIAGQHWGSVMARQVLPAALILPPVLGWFRLEGQRAGWFGVEMGLALMTVIHCVLLVALIFWSAWSLNRGDADRQRARDVLLESEERYRSLVEASSQIVWTTNAQGQVVRPVPAWQDITGQKDDEVMGSGWSEALHPEDKKRVLDSWSEAVKAKSHYEVEFRARRRDGVYRSFQARGVPVLTSDGEIREWVGTCSDITERKEAENEIRTLHGKLQQRIVELGSINKELEAFSYSVSHDLRAPLRSIDGFSQALLEDCEEKLDATGKSHLHRVRSATRHMGQLIDDLLNLARLSRVEMGRERVDLSALAAGIAAELQKAGPERPAEFILAEGLTELGDARLLKIVLENLLGNAWKFTAKCPRARVEFGALETAGSETVYYVRDNGAGFNMAYASKLFGAFQRLHSSDEFPGTGIGLATVQQIIRRHGGRTWAEGEVGKGATFYFTLGATYE